MNVKELTNELLDEMLESMGMSKETDMNSTVDGHRVLTSVYVSQFNRGVSYRVQQRETSHAASVDLAAKARFR